MPKSKARYRVVGTAALKDCGYFEPNRAHIIQFEEARAKLAEPHADEPSYIEKAHESLSALSASVKHAVFGSTAKKGNTLSNTQVFSMFSATFTFALVLVLIGA